MNVIKNAKSLGVIAVITISSLSFLTIRGETNKISNEIVALKIKKKMILDNKISLTSKKNRLISQNRIERIARDSLGMYKQNIINKEIDLSVK
tara:strand:- start:1803 stop:2081 length:279 start_codon:yes stop_codon:yes gene_type:complete